jgi:hypothetical protein
MVASMGAELGVNKHRIRRLALWAAGVAVPASACLGFSLVVPAAPEQYADVGLGLSEEEVVYRVGPPYAVLGPEGTYEGRRLSPVYFVTADDPKDQLPVGTTPSQYGAWLFEGTAAGVMVIWTAKRTVASVQCTDGEAHDCPGALGVVMGTPEQMVLARLGRPTSVGVKDGVKQMRYDDLGVTYRLTHRRVYGLTLGPRSGGAWAWVKRRWSALAS